MLLNGVRTTIERHQMIDRGDRVIIAVSGGVDSIVLLHLLHDLAPELGCELVVAHLDHGLRASSGDDARFVAQAAAVLDLPCILERVDVAALAVERRQGVEEAGREARLLFLRRVADERSAARIALGHTADDQAETILYRLARGAGARGLRGMEPVSGRVIRPLLSLSRAEVRRLASERGLLWREDESNADLRFARNRIRERVLPELELAHPGAVRAIARTAAVGREAVELEEYVVEQVWNTVCERENAGTIRLRRSELVALPGAVQAVVLREAMRRARGSLRGLARVHVAAMARLAGSSAGRSRLNLPQLRVTAVPEAIEISSASESAWGAWSVDLSLGWTALPSPCLEVEVSVRARGEGELPHTESPWTEVADADSVRFPLTARSRRSGDRFEPLGMGRDVRLASFLINARVPVDRRDRLALVCDREKIVWVAGVRLSDAVRLRDSTQRVLVLRAREVGG